MHKIVAGLGEAGFDGGLVAGECSVKCVTEVGKWYEHRDYLSKGC